MVDRTPRTLSDPRTLRALTHPVRLALLEALLSGPLTATQAGELIGETATTCSFHLRQLAQYGFVEEAGGGRGRARPWQLTHTGWSAPARPDDEEYTRAVQALDHVLLDRLFGRIRQFVDNVASYPQDWHKASTSSMQILRITAAEMAEMNAAYAELATKFRELWGSRHQDPDSVPPGALTVEVIHAAYPIESAAEAHRSAQQ